VQGRTRRGRARCAALTPVEPSAGLAPLAGLRHLRSLSLRGCRKLTNQGLESLRGLTQLSTLCLYGVARLSEKGLGPLASLPALRHLELGHTRLRDEGLGIIARLLPGLQSLSFTREEVRRLARRLARTAAMP
jgi:hypothetical protein